MTQGDHLFFFNLLREFCLDSTIMLYYLFKYESFLNIVTEYPPKIKELFLMNNMWHAFSKTNLSPKFLTQNLNWNHFRPNTSLRKWKFNHDNIHPRTCLPRRWWFMVLTIKTLISDSHSQAVARHQIQSNNLLYKMPNHMGIVLIVHII